MWNLSDDWAYRTIAYFRDHVINLRCQSGVLLVVKSHVCVSKKRGGCNKKTVKKIRQFDFEVLESLHTVLRSRMHW